MWKALFRNFGDSFLDMIRPHVEAMVRDHRESHQRAASEIMAGLIRGAKHWDYHKVRDNNIQQCPPPHDPGVTGVFDVVLGHSGHPPGTDHREPRDNEGLGDELRHQL